MRVCVVVRECVDACVRAFYIYHTHTRTHTHARTAHGARTHTHGARTHTHTHTHTYDSSHHQFKGDGKSESFCPGLGVSGELMSEEFFFSGAFVSVGYLVSWGAFVRGRSCPGELLSGVAFFLGSFCP